VPVTSATGVLVALLLVCPQAFGVRRVFGLAQLIAFRAPLGLGLLLRRRVARVRPVLGVFAIVVALLDMRQITICLRRFSHGGVAATGDYLYCPVASVAPRTPLSPLPRGLRGRADRC